MAACPQCGGEFPAGGLPDACPGCGAALVSAPPRPQLPAPVITGGIIGICVLLFVLMAARGVSITWPQPMALLPWGADFAPYTLSGQWWRLLVANFLHFGLLHLALNMWVLWDLGRMAELMFGRALYLAIYLLCGVASSVASVAWHPLAVSAGASGAIFGIAGALIAIFYLGRLALPPRVLKSTLRNLLLFAVVNLALGASVHVVNNAAHIGGLACGLVTGALLARLAPRQAPDAARRRRYVIAGVTVALVAITALVARSQAYWTHAERGETALHAGKTDLAITELSEALRRKPDLAYPHLLLGQAYGRKQDMPRAEAEFRRALQLDPADDEARYRLGWVLLMQERYSDAEPLLLQCRQNDPNDGNVELGLGILYGGMGDNLKALQAFQRASQLQPDNASAFFNAGAAALRLNRMDDAIAALQHAVKLTPNDAEAHRALARAYQGKGMLREAQENLNRAKALAAGK